MKTKLTIRAIVYLAMLASASAQYQGWQHSGSIHILTTKEGASLPATATETNFPLLVRLNKDWFDFGQAKPNGDDLWPTRLMNGTWPPARRASGCVFR